MATRRGVVISSSSFLTAWKFFGRAHPCCPVGPTSASKSVAVEWGDNCKGGLGSRRAWRPQPVHMGHSWMTRYPAAPPPPPRSLGPPQRHVRLLPLPLSLVAIAPRLSPVAISPVQLQLQEGSGRVRARRRYCPTPSSQLCVHSKSGVLNLYSCGQFSRERGSRISASERVASLL